MKILYVGHYREASGWGQAARDYILAMDSVGLDVVPRSINLASGANIPQRLLELEKKSSSGCDICIQHVLPHYMVYDGNFKKNIALFVTETDNVLYTRWPEHVNMMDEVWMPCDDNQLSLIRSNIKIPSRKIPHAVDVTKFMQELKPLDIPPLRGEYVFYFIGEFQRRKNIKALLEAFHTTFIPTEPVSLLIKTSIPGMPAKECAAKVSELCSLVKNNLRMYPSTDDYKKEIIIANRITDKELCQLHKTGHCFVMPSFGEAWCIPAMDALGFGNPVISNYIGGLKEFVSMSNGYLVGNTQTPVTGMHETFPWLSNGFERWDEVNISELGDAMRYMYSSHNKPYYKGYVNAAKNTPLGFTYEYVGNLIKEALND